MTYDIPAEDLKPGEMEEGEAPLTEQAPPGPPGHDDDHQHAVCAFVVWLSPTGQWVGSGDMTQKIQIDRPAQLHDIANGCAAVASDVAGIMTANRVMQTMMQLQQQAMEQAQAAQLLSKMAGAPGGGVDLSKLRG